MARSLVASDPFDSTTTTDLTGNWTQMNSSNAVVAKQSGNVYSRHQAAGTVRWTANSFANDQYSSLLWVQHTFSNNFIGVIARASADTNSNRDNYFCKIDTNAAGSPFTVTLGKTVNGSETSLNAESVAISTGNRIEIECEGTTIRGMKDGSLLSANFSQTDTALSSGAPGVYAWSTAVTEIGSDDWEGGDITGSAATTKRLAALGVG